MESLTRSLNYELPPNSDLHFDQYAQHMLENSKTVQVAAAAAIASTPTITTFDAASTSPITSGEFLQKLGASLLNSIQLQRAHKFIGSASTTTTTSTLTPAKMDSLMDFAPNAVVIDSSFDAMDELQKQLEYDKFMNEVWIGIVLTLILISMVFCVCSCFLYHQFRTWKRNYHSTVAQAQDLESMKLQPDLEDPVPEYTLVSGLPSYEAALALLHKTPQSCLIVYPSVFSVFNKNEKSSISEAPTATAQLQQEQQQQLQQLQQQVVEVTTPLLSATGTLTAATGAHAHATISTAVKLTDVIAEKSPLAAQQLCHGEKAPSYEQALLDSRKIDKC